MDPGFRRDDDGEGACGSASREAERHAIAGRQALVARARREAEDQRDALLADDGLRRTVGGLPRRWVEGRRLVLVDQLDGRLDGQPEADGTSALAAIAVLDGVGIELLDDDPQPRHHGAREVPPGAALLYPVEALMEPARRRRQVEHQDGRHRPSRANGEDITQPRPEITPVGALPAALIRDLPGGGATRTSDRPR